MELLLLNAGLEQLLVGRNLSRTALNLLWRTTLSTSILLLRRTAGIALRRGASRGVLSLWRTLLTLIDQSALIFE